MSLDRFYHVRFDDTHVHRQVELPGREPWSDAFAWADVVRVCYEAADFLASDTIHVFVRERAESYAIPSEADGGAALWGEFVRRGLFDAKAAIAAVTSGPGVTCWPDFEGSAGAEGAAGAAGAAEVDA